MRKIQVRPDFAYSIQNDYLDWGTFDRIKPLYFSNDTVKFFRSKRYTDPFWSESKQAFIWVQSDKSPLNPRQYSIRSIDLNAQIRIISKHGTLKQAETELKKLCAN